MLVLVDFGNFWARYPKSEPAMAGEFLDYLLGEIVKLFVNTGTTIDLDVRLYGGWVTATGNYSGMHQAIAPVIPDLRGLRNGVRVRPTLALAPLNRDELRFVGTVRRSSGKRTQKIVDTHMVADTAAALYGTRGDRVVVVSDDDDLLPAVLLVPGLEPNSPLLVRRRSVGEGMNDSLISKANIDVLTIAV